MWFMVTPEIVGKKWGETDDRQSTPATPSFILVRVISLSTRRLSIPRKAKAKTEAEATEAKSVEAPPVEAKPVRGAKAAAIIAALKAHKDKSPKEIAELLTASGMPTTAGQVSNIKSLLASKRKAKAEPAAEEVAAPELPKDAVSVALLVKAKKLVQELGGVKEAKIALNALAQLMD